MNEPLLLRLDPDVKLKLDEQDSIVLNSTLTSPKTMIDLPTKSYLGSLHENSRNRRDLSSVLNDQDNEFDINKLTNLDSVTVNRDPSSDNVLANKNYIDDKLDRNTVLRFNQRSQIYVKISVGNDVYNVTENDKLQIIDTTITKYPNTGGYLLQSWVIKCNGRNNKAKIKKFIKSTKTNSPTSHSGATSLPPVGDSFRILRQVLVIMVRMFLSASSEQIIFKLLI